MNASMMKQDEDQEGVETGGVVPRWAVANVTIGLLATIGWAGTMYGRQLADGLAVTGLDRPVYWGLYITNFIFCVGISAAAIGVAAIVHIFDRPRLHPLAVIADLVALSFLLLAGLFITVDLGRPDRVLSLVRFANPTSMLFWDVVAVFSYGLICVTLLYFDVRADLVRRFGPTPLVRLVTLGRTATSAEALAWDKRLLQGVAWVSIPVAIATCSVEAWIMGFLQAQPGWNTSILAPIFISSGVVSGVAAVILAAMLGRSIFSLRIDSDSILAMGRYLALLVPLLMYLLLSELMTVGYSGAPREIDVFHELLFGRFAGLFRFDLLVGILVPFLLLGVPALRTLWTTALACVLLIVGVFAERAWILLPSLMRPHAPASVAGALYTPSAVEWSLMAGAYAMGLLLFLSLGTLLFGPRLTPVSATERSRALTLEAAGYDIKQGQA